MHSLVEIAHNTASTAEERSVAGIRFCAYSSRMPQRHRCSRHTTQSRVFCLQWTIGLLD